LVERWALLAPTSRALAEDYLRYLGQRAKNYDLPQADLQYWADLAANPSFITDDPNRCLRDCFVLAVGRAPA
jgi:hypothetical protein